MVEAERDTMTALDEILTIFGSELGAAPDGTLDVLDVLDVEASPADPELPRVASRLIDDDFV